MKLETESFLVPKLSTFVFARDWFTERVERRIELRINSSSFSGFGETPVCVINVNGVYSAHLFKPGSGVRQDGV